MHVFQTTKKQSHLNEKQVLTKAIRRLKNQFDLTQKDLAMIIGRSNSTFTRIFKTSSNVAKASYLDPHSKEGQLALLLIRIYKNLNIMFGGNIDQCRLWLRSENKHLEGKPLDLIKSPEGLVTVVQYLDFFRGKN